SSLAVMNNNLLKALIPIGLILILLLAALTSLTVIVEAGHVGVVRTLGAVKPVALKEGLHFKKPFVDQVEQMDVRLVASNAEATAASKDLQTVSTQVTIQYSLNGELAAPTYQWIGTLPKVSAILV